MTEPLTLDRFRMLADAYGGAVARWPRADRDAATRLLADPAAVAILAEAEALDATLDAWRVAAPGAALRESVLAQAPGTGRNRRARLWWSGIGIATALAGAAAGSVAAAAAAAAPADPPAESVTAFGDVAGPGA